MRSYDDYLDAFEHGVRRDDREVQRSVGEMWARGLDAREIAEQAGYRIDKVRDILYALHYTFEEVHGRDNRPIITLTCAYEPCGKPFPWRTGTNARQPTCCSPGCRMAKRDDERKVQRTPEEIADSRRRTAAYLAIERRKAADEFFAKLEYDRALKRQRERER